MSFARQFRRRIERERRRQSVEPCALCGKPSAGTLADLPLCLYCRDNRVDIHPVTPEEALRIARDGTCGCPGCTGIVIVPE